MYLENEKRILNILKYAPLVPLIIFSIILTIILIYEKENELVKQIQSMKTQFIKENKLLAKNDINKIVELIDIEITDSEKSLKEFIKSKVYEAYKVASSIYNEGSQKDRNGNFLTDEKIFDTIKYALTGMSYNDNRGYFFIDDVYGTKLLQPFNKSLEGKNFLNFEDPKGYKFIQKRVEVIKNKSESFDEYYWYKPHDKVNLYKKISFYKYFEPYSISIGTGEYIKDFEDELKKNILKWIKKVRSDKNSYIFVFDEKGIALSHINEEYLGKNMMNLRDNNGRYILKDIISFAKNKQEGFINYNSSYRGEFNSPDKISYVKYLGKWGWTIGTGFYLDSLKEEIKQKEKELRSDTELIITKLIFISVIITLALILITFYISKIISNIFTNYKNNLTKQMKITLEKETLLVQQSKMAAMGEMIDNIAHQWKQPLGTIRVSNQLIKFDKELGEGTYSKEDVSGAIENIEQSVVHLSDTIDDFRNFFNTNKEKTSFNIKETFIKTLKLLNAEVVNSNINIIKNIENNTVVGYQNELIQVLINIIRNSVDEFVKKEHNQERYIFVDIYAEDNQLIITIKDNCGGIPDEIISKVFTSHFTTKKNSGGTGIGLYMSKGIMENMEGTISVTTQEYTYNQESYRGAEFKLVLPLSSNNEREV